MLDARHAGTPVQPPCSHLALRRQAFAAVQASTVHLQGVSVGKRFSLVPLGPPLLAYSSTSKVLCICVYMIYC